MDEELKLDERIITGIELGESHFREFKSAHQRKSANAIEPRPLKEICRDIGDVLVSFSNADGGELFIGVEDDGSITGIPHKPEQLDAMKKAYINYILPQTPLAPPLIKFTEIEDKNLLYFRVNKSTKFVHLTSDGRCLQRFDRENRPVPAERIEGDRQESVSREYDRSFISNASIKDLDIELLDSIVKQLALGYSPEKFLQYLDLAEFTSDGLKLRRAALLLFATEIVRWHPRCGVRILRIRGTEMGSGHDYNVVEDDMIAGNIVSILENAWDALRPHLARTKFQANALFRESIIYPEEACREALINAIAHRDYSIEGKPVEILVFDDRMEVQSPGRLLSSISVANLKDLKGSHQSRNVFVARVLRELGYMREMGEGIRRIYSSVRNFELVDPEIFSDHSSFVVTLFHKSIFSPKDVQWLSGFSDFNLSKDEQRVVLLGRDGRLLSTNDIIQTIGIVDTEDFRALYEKLMRKGIIFNAKPIIQSHSRRSIPRFQIRPPHEIQQFLAELERELYRIGPVERFNRDIVSKLKYGLSLTSPYYQNPTLSLRALEYISESYTPLPRASMIWSRVPAHDIKEPDRIIGDIIILFADRGFGFAETVNGERFFLHVYQFVNRNEWSRVKEGLRVEFKAGEHNIPGKPRTAKAIKLLD